MIVAWNRPDNILSSIQKILGMKHISLVFLTLMLVSAATAASATFETDQNQQVNIGGEEISLELIGVNEVTGEDGLYKATFLQGDKTATVVGWDYYEHGNRLPSRLNGEYVGLMNWDGEGTNDDNTDDTATLAWGKSYFPCEEFQTGENQYKFCGDEVKTLNVGGEEINLDFQYVRTDSDHSQLKHAAFLRGDETVTISGEDAPQYRHTLGEINGRTAYLTKTRGSETERAGDDAVVVELRESELYDVEILVGERSGKSVEFYTNAESSLGIETIEWDLNGDNQYEEQGRNIEQTFQEPGEKTVSMKVDDGVQTREVSKTITIEEENSEYQVREADNVKDYLGGNVDNIESETEIKFGNNLQNSLFIHSVEGDYARAIEIKASARSREGERFSLSWDNLINGVEKDFASGSYTMHLCGDSGPEGVSIAISKYSGSQGYGACFNDEKKGLKEPAEYSTVEYNEGDIVNVSAGEKLVFGENILFIDDYTYSESIERYSLESYANKLADNHELSPVRGTATEGLFYGGEYAVHFCNFYESSEEGELVVSQRDVDECSRDRDGDENEGGSGDDGDDQSGYTQRVELNRGWNNIAVNVEGETLEDAAAAGTCNMEGEGWQVGEYTAYIFQTDDSENGFAPIDLSDELDPSTGYTVGVQQSCELVFSGDKAVSHSYERNIYGGQWNLVTLPPEFSPNDLKQMVDSREGINLYPYDGEYFHVHEGQSNGQEIWTYPSDSLSNSKSVWVAPSNDITVNFAEEVVGAPGL